jgi:uncharacterized protein (TIGR02452 family)
VVAENLLGKGMKRATEDPLVPHKGLETLTHHGGGIMCEGDQDDLGRNGVGMGQKVGDAGCEGRRLTGPRGGQDPHVRGRWLTDNRVLFVIQREGSFAKDPSMDGGHSPVCGHLLNILPCQITMDKLLHRRIEVWKETEEVAHKIGAPPSLKFTRHQVPSVCRFDAPVRIRVENIDCLDCARDMSLRGLRPVVLNLSDDLYAGGAVETGSGAQEESLWRRTALSATQHQGFYPLCGTRSAVDLIYSAGVPVLRTSEATGYAWIPAEARWYCDFIACPALKYPVIMRSSATGEKDIKPADEAVLEARLRLILDTAAYMGNNAIVLGAMGCGAWRTPVRAVARVFGRVLPEYSGVFSEITVAILTTHSTGQNTIAQFRAALRLT